MKRRWQKGYVQMYNCTSCFSYCFALKVPDPLEIVTLRTFWLDLLCNLTLSHFLGRNSKKNTLYVCYAFCFICASAPYIRATIAPHQYGVSWKTERSRGRKDYSKLILNSVWGKVKLRLRQNIFYIDIFSKGWKATSFVVYFDNIGVHSMHCSIA